MSKVSPEPPASPAASEGTMLHDVLEGKPAPAPLTDEQQRCVDFCSDKTAELLKMVFGDKQFKIEREVELFRNGEYWGRADLLAHGGGIILILDTKFGRIPVTPANKNWQIRGLLVGAKEKFLCLKALGAILQPRAPKEEQVSVVEYSAAELDQSAAIIDHAIALAKQPDAPLKPSDEACKYCPANQCDPNTGKPICPALEGHFTMMHVAPLSSHEITDPAMMGKYLEAARLVGKMCESIEYHALELAKKSGGLPGFKLKDGRKMRKVTDANAAFGALSGRMKAEDFTKACKVQIGELEEVFKAATGLKGMAAKNELEHTLIDAHCLEITNGNQTLVKTEEP